MQRLVIQLSEYRQLCVSRLARASQNKNCGKLWIMLFYNLYFISFTSIYILFRGFFKSSTRSTFFFGKHPINLSRFSGLW